MLRKTITYVDFNDVERSEDFYFNLTVAEITDMEMSVEGGLKALLMGIQNSENAPEAYKFIKQIIRASYGEKSTDGRSFTKSEEKSRAFETTEAYSTLIEEMFQDPSKLGDFVEGLMPQKLMKQVKAISDKHGGDQDKILDELSNMNPVQKS